MNIFIHFRMSGYYTTEPPDDNNECLGGLEGIDCALGIMAVVFAGCMFLCLLLLCCKQVKALTCSSRLLEVPCHQNICISVVNFGSIHKVLYFLDQIISDKRQTAGAYKCCNAAYFGLGLNILFGNLLNFYFSKF